MSDQPHDQNDSSNTAVLDQPPKAAAGKSKPKPSNQPKRQPPYAVVILNDRWHSFAYVIEVLQSVFGHHFEKAYQLTMQAHKSGRAIVWSGPMETAEFKRDRVRGFGPDLYASYRPVQFPLGCEIEPLPQ